MEEAGVSHGAKQREAAPQSAKAFCVNHPSIKEYCKGSEPLLARRPYVARGTHGARRGYDGVGSWEPGPGCAIICAYCEDYD